MAYRSEKASGKRWDRKVTENIHMIREEVQRNKLIVRNGEQKKSGRRRET